eukprot:COSAG02_NODE_5088_length_4644_cov_5.531353_3_plen_97_part_00
MPGELGCRFYAGSAFGIIHPPEHNCHSDRLAAHSAFLSAKLIPFLDSESFLTKYGMSNGFRAIFRNLSAGRRPQATHQGNLTDFGRPVSSCNVSLY